MTTEQKLEIETWEKEFYAHKCNLLLALLDDIKEELKGIQEELKARKVLVLDSGSYGFTGVTTSVTPTSSPVLQGGLTTGNSAIITMNV